MIHMVIADRDEEYVYRLTCWFRENKPNQFQISAFTEKNSLEKFLQENGTGTDIILVDEYHLNELPVNRNNVILLRSPLTPVSELPCIDKYQPASALCSAVLSIVSQWSFELPKPGKVGKSDIIACFSPDPVLKSTLALLMAGLSQDFVYVNFEPFPFCSPVPEPYKQRNLSDILYHIKASKGNVSMILESAVFSDPSGIACIPPMDNPRDMSELSEKEIGLLIDSLQAWGRFSKVIADIECGVGFSTIRWFEKASLVIIPFTIVQLEQMKRLKNMIQGITFVDPEKFVWVLCGEGYSDELCGTFEHFHSIPWLKPLLSEWRDYLQNNSVRNELESILL